MGNDDCGSTELAEVRMMNDERPKGVGFFFRSSFIIHRSSFPCWVVLIVLAVFSAGVVPPGGAPSKPVMPGVKCRIWRSLPGAQITDTLATADLLRLPDETKLIDTLEFAPGLKDGWACSLSGLITPPVTGAYWFRIASRDSGLLFLSSDGTAANRQFIAETPAATDLHNYKAYSAQTSQGIPLVAGKKYFIQAICKSDPGPGATPVAGAHTAGAPTGGVSIGWQMPGGAFQGPIPADRFSPAADDLPPPSLRVDHFKLSLKPEAAPTTQPGIHKFVRGAQFEVDGHWEDMSYLMDLPRNFDTTTDTKPMLVFLHGNNRQGYTLEGTEQNGPVHDLEKNTRLSDWLPMIVMCPQLPPGWRWDTPGAAQAVNALVEELCKRHPRIDSKRIYLTGLSMGGKGTWLTVENSPQTYAAVVPISAVDVRPDQAPQWLKNLPELHIVCGSEDGGFTAGSHRMYDALKPVLGDRVQLTVFEHEGHGVWDHYYATQSFYEDLMKFSR